MKPALTLVIAALAIAITPVAAIAAPHQTTPGPGYITVQMGRSIEGSFTGGVTACRPVPGIETLQNIAADLQGRGMIGTSTVVVDRTNATTEKCYQNDVYADWADLHALNATYGWQVDSGGQTHDDMVTMTPAEQETESCDTLPTFTAEGFNDAWGLNRPGNPGDSFTLEGATNGQAGQVSPGAEGAGGADGAGAPRRVHIGVAGDAVNRRQVRHASGDAPRMGEASRG